MRSGSRAMVKKKRPSAGPKAMKVHPKKMGSVMSAGPRTRDRGQNSAIQLDSARLSPTSPSPFPSPSFPGPTDVTRRLRAAAAGRAALGGV